METTSMTKVEFQEWMIKRAPTPEIAEKIKQGLSYSEEDRNKENDINKRMQFNSFKCAQRENCGLSGEQWSHTWKGFFYAGSPADKESQARAVRSVRALADKYPKIERGLCLFGKPGRSKDYLMDCLVIHIIERPKVSDVRKIFYLDIEKMMLDEWTRHSEEVTRIEDLLSACDLLIIGDLHDMLTCKTDAICRAMLRIIDKIERTGKPFLCATSNKPLETFNIQERLGSRLSKIMEWLEITGTDRRPMRQPVKQA